MTMLEKDIEKRVCDYAKEKGVLVYKFTSPNRAAVPDRLFIIPFSGMFFIEFKQFGKKATPQQEREHQRLRQAGVTVYVIDDVEVGKAMIDHECKTNS